MTEKIVSSQNGLIKQAAALKQKKIRDKTGLFVVEGVRLCEDFAASDWQRKACIYTEEAASHRRVAELLAVLAAKKCRMASVSEKLFAKISDTEQPQGVLVIGAKQPLKLSDMLTSSQPLIAVLDGIQDPGNVGTIIRNADAAGCSGAILTCGSADLYAGKTLRATMGALFHFPVMEGTDRTAVLNLLADAGIPLAVTVLESAKPYYEADLSGPLAVVFGNEGQGIGPELIENAGTRIYVPMIGRAESLNVASAAAVVLFEAARQRRVNL